LQRSKLKYDETLSFFAFTFNLRRYVKGWGVRCAVEIPAGAFGEAPV